MLATPAAQGWAEGRGSKRRGNESKSHEHHHQHTNTQTSRATQAPKITQTHKFTNITSDTNTNNTDTQTTRITQASKNNTNSKSTHTHKQHKQHKRTILHFQRVGNKVASNVNEIHRGKEVGEKLAELPLHRRQKVHELGLRRACVPHRISIATDQRQQHPEQRDGSSGAARYLPAAEPHGLCLAFAGRGRALSPSCTRRHGAF